MMGEDRSKGKEAIKYDVTLLADHDIHLNQPLGSHLLTTEWAPNADKIHEIKNPFPFKPEGSGIINLTVSYNSKKQP
jgi:hypothetical protein